MNNKDLIEDIKAKMKDAQELPYREGAWEKFAAQQGHSNDRKVIFFRRLASIAAVGLAVLGVSLYIFKGQQSDIPGTKLAQSNVIAVENNSKILEEKSPLENPLSSESALMANNDSHNDIINKGGVDKNTFSNVPFASISTVEDVNLDLALMQTAQSSLTITSLNTVEPKVLPILQTTKEETSYPELLLPTTTALASQTISVRLSNNTADQVNQSRNMALGDKFQLGLFVSPNRTSDQYDVGAGFLVSYALTKKISLRTGTSYNSYSVGVMKNPMESASIERVNMESAYNNSVAVGDKTSLYNSQQMIIPNINAVMGKIQAIEVPLDITYQFNKGFYSSAGVSYSAIVKQEREAQYLENVGMLSLQDKESLIPAAAKSLNKMQVKTIKSLEENVNPNGFSGFANFSIGKKVNINNKMSLSLEPYIKVPLGQFRNSDLDYTNSGIRIITTF